MKHGVKELASPSVRSRGSGTLIGPKHHLRGPVLASVDALMRDWQRWLAQPPRPSGGFAGGDRHQSLRHRTLRAARHARLAALEGLSHQLVALERTFESGDRSAAPARLASAVDLCLAASRQARAREAASAPGLAPALAVEAPPRAAPRGEGSASALSGSIARASESGPASESAPWARFPLPTCVTFRSCVAPAPRLAPRSIAVCAPPPRHVAPRGEPSRPRNCFERPEPRGPCSDSSPGVGRGALAAALATLLVAAAFAAALAILRALSAPARPLSLGYGLAPSERSAEAPRAAVAPAAGSGGLAPPAAGPDAGVDAIVERLTRTESGRARLRALLFRCGPYLDRIRAELRSRRLPEGLSAVPMVESGCRPKARSRAGALGLWQLMAVAARAHGLRMRPGELDERLDPLAATRAALRFLARLRARFPSWELALAAYNAGPTRVARALARTPGARSVAELARGGELPEETARYVPRVRAHAVILGDLERFDLHLGPRMPPPATQPLAVGGGVGLSLVARAAETSVAELRRLNPALIGTTTPGSELYELRVPWGRAEGARALLPVLRRRGSLAPGCVGEGFDWGRNEAAFERWAACWQAAPGAAPR